MNPFMCMESITHALESFGRQEKMKYQRVIYVKLCHDFPGVHIYVKRRWSNCSTSLQLFSPFWTPRWSTTRKKEQNQGGPQLISNLRSWLCFWSKVEESFSDRKEFFNFAPSFNLLGDLCQVSKVATTIKWENQCPDFMRVLKVPPNT